jgi:hypothetical protein
MFLLTQPVNFPCGRKLEGAEKTHDFRQSVDKLFSHESTHESVAKLEPTISEVLISSIIDNQRNGLETQAKALMLLTWHPWYGLI